MASGKITNTQTLTGSLNTKSNFNASVTTGSGTTDHSRLTNRDKADQHPIESITNLRTELDSKLDSKTAMPLLEEALKNKACGLYYDAKKELARKSYWYLTADIDEKTKMGKLGPNNSYLSGPYDLGAGGGSGGGGAGITTVEIQIIDWPTAVVVGNDQIKTDLKIRWSSSKEGTVINEAGTVYVRINDTQVKVLANQNPGEVIIEDITSYPAFATKDNKIEVEVMDIYGSTTKAVSTIKGISLKLSSNFTAGATTFINGNINYTYIPEGDAEKTVYFEIDGVPQTPVITNVSKVEAKPYQIKGLSHGSHTLKVYFTANIGGQDIPSNTLFYDLICVDPNNPTPIIASDFTALNQEQYSSFEIPYYVYANGKTTLPITLKATSSEGETTSNTQGTVGKRLSWPYRADSDGVHTLEIFCENAKPKRFEINVTKNEITVVPEANNVALALSAHNRKNDDVATRDSWTYTTDDIEPITYNCKFENFNWSSNGWIFKQEDQTSVLRVGAGAKVTIPLQLFGTHAEGTDGIVNAGRTIELDFSTHSIRNYDTPIISCLDKVTSDFYEIEESFEQADARKEGFEVTYDYKTLNEALPCSEVKQSIVFTYKNESWINEDNIIINLTDYGITLESKDINPSGEDLGTAVDGDKIIIKYSKEHKGLQVTPKLASLRSLKSYLEAPYKEDEHVRITFVIEPEIKENSSIKHQIIWVYINGIASAALNYPEGDDFIQKQAQEIEIGSTEAVVDIYNIRVYKAALTHKQIVNNWIADTPDMATRAARFKHNDILNSSDEIIYDKLPTDLPYIIWGIDRLPTSKNDIRYGTANFVDPTNSKRNFTAIDGEYKVQGTSSALYPTKNIRLRLKKGKGGPNLEWYDEEGNDLIIKNGGKGFPITYPDGIGVDYFTFKVDYASSEGANNVELTKLYNDASIKYGLLTPPQQKDSKIRVGIDGFPIAVFYKDPSENISFHTKANFNNDKANEDVYGFADGDESWETTNNSANVAKYKVELTADNWKDGFEGRFPEDNTDISKLQLMVDWVASTNRDPAVVTNAQLVDSHGNPTSITFKYKDAKQSTDGKVITTEVTKTFDTDTAEYRLTKFKAELANWFNVDSCLFYYLFTELFLMIDSRAKNAFPTYFATRTNKLAVDDKGNAIPNTYTDGGNRWYWIPYDMDTAIGIDNKGKLVFDYNLEDIDTIEGGSAVYNGQDSVMWCNIRDAFAGELAAMYTTLRNQELISYDEIDKRFTEHQRKWPEVLLNIDAYNKYVTPLPGADYLAMLQGTKEQQRKWWLYNRFKYIDSKYTSGEAAADKISFRTYIKAGQEKPDIVVVPYASIYASVSYANGQDLVTARAKSRDVEVTLPNPFGVNEIYTDQEVAIYSASQLKSVGDLAGFYLDTLDISQATRLQELKVGDDRTTYPNYKNPHLKTLVVGNNDLLRVIDARNCTGLGTPGAGRTPSPDLKGCPNIEEIYFTGTQINGIQLPDGGTIKKLHLPGTLTSLKLQNQPLLEELYLDTLRTITRSTNQSEYSFTGMVVDRGGWDKLNANANIYLADSTDPSNSIIKVSIADKTIYDLVVQNEEQNRPTLLNITCNYIDIQYDLVTNEEDNTESVQLGEYLTRKITQLEQITELDPTKTIAKLILSISDTIDVPKVAEYKVTSFEELWLENLPSNVIKAREFVTNMRRPTKDDPSKTGIYIIGINETFVDTYDEEGKVVRKAWEQIKDFYDLLDQHCGIDVTGSGTKPEKAQISGVINIDEISYKDYIELTSRYPEVTINAKQIECIIKFYNENQLCKIIKIPIETTLNAMNKLVLIGKKIEFPSDPKKQHTQVNYYEFKDWESRKAIYSPDTDWTYEDTKEIVTKDSLFTADSRIDAVYSEHLQRYGVTFDLGSDIILIDEEHQNLIVEYGSSITPPTLSNIPADVEFRGWYTEAGTPWIFEGERAMKVVDNVTLYAKWVDSGTPEVTLTPTAYNTFKYVAKDNLGIVGWAIKTNLLDEPEDEDWHTVEGKINLEGIAPISSAGDHYFWIKDRSGNKTYEKITAYSISISKTPGISKYKITETNTTNTISNFAIGGTSAEIEVELDSHYQKLYISVNGNVEPQDTATATFLIDRDTSINLTCSPRNYVVSFDLLGRGDSSKTPSQIVTYGHLATEPVAQYDKNSRTVLEGWYSDHSFTTRWNFNEDIIEESITLVANWIVYNEPTKVTVHLPKGDILVNLKYAQYGGSPVRVKWGDGSKNDQGSEYFTDDDNYTQVVTLSHIYQNQEEREYIIEILGPTSTKAYYSLGGGGRTSPLVLPIEYVTDIDFSCDLVGANPGIADFTGNTIQNSALYGANLTKIKLTPYMESISASCFANCANVTELEIPKNIVRIGNSAFSGCNGISNEIVLHSNLTLVGSNIFDYCTAIPKIKLLTDSTKCSYGGQVFRHCDNLTTIEFGNKFTEISPAMFSSCNSLVNIVIPKTVTKIANEAFRYCGSLKTVTTDAINIGSYAFANCGNLEKVILTNKNLNVGLEFPGDSIFDICPKLNSAGPITPDYEYDINFAWDTIIPDHALSRGYYYGDQGFTSSSSNSLNEVVLPNTLKTIGKHAFANGYFSTINFPEGTETLDEFAFEGCALVEVDLPATITDIKARVFTQCNLLTKAKIRAKASKTKVSIYTNAWFLDVPEGLIIRIPNSTAASSTLVNAAYGECWNCRNKTSKFEYKGFKDSDIE